MNNISREGGIVIKLLRAHCVPTLLIVALALLILPMIKGSPVQLLPCSAFTSSKTLIIDAGHGGEDGGAVSVSGLKESAINLSIAKRIENLSALFGVRVTMTRESEDIDYPADAETIRARKRADQEARVNTINACPDAILLSIHQNYYPGVSPHGAQVLYSGTAGSEALGILMQELFVKKLENNNKRTSERVSDTIYLMKKISCPAVLVECGFLSNPQDEAKLIDPSYQIKLAAVMLSAVLGYMCTDGSI